jgi:hypothetical protein
MLFVSSAPPICSPAIAETAGAGAGAIPLSTGFWIGWLGAVWLGEDWLGEGCPGLAEFCPARRIGIAANIHARIKHPNIE